MPADAKGVNRFSHQVVAVRDDQDGKNDINSLELGKRFKFVAYYKPPATVFFRLIISLTEETTLYLQFPPNIISSLKKTTCDDKKNRPECLTAIKDHLGGCRSFACLQFELHDRGQLVTPKGFVLSNYDTKTRHTFVLVVSLAAASRFSLYLPRDDLTNEKYKAFAEVHKGWLGQTADQKAELERMMDLQQMYKGKGGAFFSDQDKDSLLRSPSQESISCKAASTQQGLQSPAVPDRLSCVRDDGSPAPSQVETDSGESTIPADTPPGYRNPTPEYDNPPPEYPDANESQHTAKRQSRQSSEEVGSYPPSKRRDRGAVAKGEAAWEETPEAADLFSHPSFRPFIRLFETQVKKTEQLADELGELRKSHAQLEGEASRLREKQDEVEAQVVATNKQQELLEGRTCRLEEDYEEVRKQLPDIHCEAVDAVRDHIGNALQELVEELFEDMGRDWIKDTLPQLVEELLKNIPENYAGMSRPSLKALIDALAKDAVGEHFARFQARFIQACKE